MKRATSHSAEKRLLQCSVKKTERTATEICS
jgi:hypothetical protein